MRYFIGLFVTATLVFLLGSLNAGAHIESFFSAVLVSFVLSILNAVVRPILEFISIPITFMTLGLFMLVINAVIVLLAGELVDGFVVHGFWGGMMFSLCLALSQGLAFGAIEKKEVKN